MSISNIPTHPQRATVNKGSALADYIQPRSYGDIIRYQDIERVVGEKRLLQRGGGDTVLCHSCRPRDQPCQQARQAQRKHPEQRASQRHDHGGTRRTQPHGRLLCRPASPHERSRRRGQDPHQAKAAPASGSSERHGTERITAPFRKPSILCPVVPRLAGSCSVEPSQAFRAGIRRVLSCQA